LAIGLTLLAGRPAIIGAVAVNQAVCWQQCLWAHTNPSWVNSIGAAFQWLFVCIVVSAKFVRVHFLLVVPDIKRNTIRGALFVLPEATFPSF